MAAAFVGLTHMGVVASVGWASRFGGAVAVGPDAERVAMLREGRLPFAEPGLAECLAANRERCLFTTDYRAVSAADLVFLSEDVRTDEANRSSLDTIRSSIEQALPQLKNGATLLVMSQLPVGSTRELAAHIQARRSDVAVLYLAETLVIGEALRRFVNPERFIVGKQSTDAVLPGPVQLALESFSCPIVEMTYESAELTKMAINLYLSTSVTFANTLADLCEAASADIDDVNRALRLDRRIGPHAYLQPGLGLAGGNLERDLVNLLEFGSNRHVAVPLIETIIQCSHSRLDWLVQRLEAEVFHACPTPLLAIWGLAYKKGTASLKNAVSIRLVERLAGRCQVVAHDPLVTSLPGFPAVRLVPAPQEALVDADGLIILTPHDEYLTLDVDRLVERMATPIVIDCAGVTGEARASGRARIFRMGRGQ